MLLGEPGIGKSTEIQELCGDGLLLDLRAFSQFGEVMEDRHAREMLAADGEHVLCLDSIDELRHLQSNAFLVAARLLPELDAARLRLRIASRTVDWVPELEAALTEMYGGSIEVRELCPLREKDVEIECCRHGVDFGAFRSHLDLRGVHHLAARPLSLGLMIPLFKRGGTLPDESTLLDEACLQMAAEDETRRPAAHDARQLEPAHAVAVAQRLAAMQVFCGRAGFSTVGAHEAVAPSDLTIAESAGELEAVGDVTFEVTPKGVKEVLSTALFTGLGTRRVTFFHRSIAEHLAFGFLRTRRLDEKQLHALLFQPGPSGERRVAPAVRGIACRLATEDPSLFRVLAECDPVALVQSEVIRADRPALVDGLLDALERGDEDDAELFEGQTYGRLEHAGLADQLRPVIQDAGRNFFARRFALDVAGGCQLLDLAPDLAALALDQQEDWLLRRAATRALMRLPDTEAVAGQRVRLAPLLCEPTDRDPDDDLLGLALRVLWPSHLDTPTMLAGLRRARRPNYSGSYSMFLHSVPERLAADDMALAVQWCSEQPRLAEHASDVLRLARRIADRAWSLGGDAALVDAMASFVVSRARLNDAPWGSAECRVSTPLAWRRMVMERVVAPVGPLTDAILFSFVSSGLVQEGDGEWLLARFHAAAPGSHERRCLVELLHSFDRFVSAEVREELLELYAAGEKVIRARFDDDWGPVDLDSERAADMRSRHERLMRLRAEAEQEEEPAAPPDMALLRTESLAQGPRRWRHLVHVLEADAEGMIARASFFEPDITQLPGWNLADQDERLRIEQMAAQFLAAFEASTDEWPAVTVENHRFDFAGYRALFLLQRRGAAIDPQVWRTWARPVGGILLLSRRDDEDVAAVHESLLQQAFSEAPDCVLSGVCAVLAQDADRDPGHLLHLARIESVWDVRMSEGLWRWAMGRDLSPQSWQDLLSALIERGYQPALDRALELVGNDAEPALRVASGAALWTHCEDCGWAALWPVICAHAEVGRALFEQVLMGVEHWSREIGHAARLTTDQLAQLAAFLYEQYPPGGDPDHGGRMHAVTARESVGNYRHAVLRGLVDRGAAAEIRAIEERLGCDLQFYRRAAEKRFLVTNWQPMSPSELMELVSRPGRRLVRSAPDLMEVVVESLGRIAAGLHGRDSPVRDLWDRRAKKRGKQDAKYRPLDEEEVSDWLRRLLEQDLDRVGVVALREVQVRRGLGEFPGQRTDIWVCGRVEEQPELVQIVIEVKGCWNPDLMTALGGQLVQGYLASTGLRHGIYLVAGFQCASWDAADRRLAASKRRGTLGEVQAELDEQAAGHAPGLDVRAVCLDCSIGD